ncbi:hypothetical protein BTA51_16285 [Hahella sp. CCB-MM4]|uniref:substrate-binding periplasmic protein n=1 Tax=Hahella sp. (strain CCB-MM4) TaxID=1926491 RepID=UPI000B9A6128|nr:transporter substrate-binding domain-containing protein [Hahella sp. CCB-MM4]OZG72297.1 hypothetical protein BTA51_16285 [Hahella sp. CCB-MM4]
MKSLVLTLLLLVCVISSAISFADSSGTTKRILYPSLDGNERFEDLREILGLALQKTEDDFGPFELLPSYPKMTESRLLQELEAGRRIDVMWSSTSPEKEKKLLPIRIPLRKGILGYRICFIYKHRQNFLHGVKTLQDLQELRIGQGIGWGDVEIYRAAGIIVEQSTYDNLFKMVNSNRFDLFPRGISEIYQEYELYASDNPNLHIDDHLLIYYPWPYYFFTSKNDIALANRLETGLWRMINDGTFDELFFKYNRKSILRGKLSDRHLISIDNPNLTKETPLGDSRLWFDPFADPLN